MTTHSTVRRSGFALAGILALLVLVLAADALVRVLAWRDRLDATALSAFIAFEILRMGVILVAVLLTLSAVKRTGSRPEAAWFALGMLFVAVAVARGLTGPLPGAGQEALARALLERGVSLPVLAIVFVRAEWVAWLALPPLLHFAALYPRALSEADVASSALAQRAGTLRGVPGAGADVGVLLRRLAAGVLTRGWPASRALWIVAIGAGVLHTAAVVGLGGAARVAAVAAALLAALLALTVVLVLLRAGAAVGTAEDRRFHAELFRGIAVTSLLLLVAAVTSAAGVAMLPGALALYLAPLVLLVAGLRAVRRLPDAPADVPQPVWRVR